ncbi:O-fucosyltransferase 30 [Sesamum angolense]|uniref:O-fucosyltransferase 30 n=1 Tax=Sesamum angolense TaxID=2727404 RepID=A0AAE1X351_9LAMI|nr:O-fucosyltransferase 30 [Sesamum angolense]
MFKSSLELVREFPRYISMADIIDLSSLVSAVRFIDFRVFVSMLCGVNLNLSCADVELKKKRKISFLRRRKDVYKALGPGSAAGTSTVLALGSLFTSSYKGSESHIDIHEAPQDQKIQLLIQKVEFLPFVAEILSAGKKFALETIKAPFLCAQLRLLDGQFKNHWKGTFLVLKQKLELLKQNGNAMKLQSGFSNFEGRDQQCDALSLPDIRLYVEETICSCASLGFVGLLGQPLLKA